MSTTYKRDLGIVVRDELVIEVYRHSHLESGCVLFHSRGPRATVTFGKTVLKWEIPLRSR